METDEEAFERYRKLNKKTKGVSSWPEFVKACPANCSLRPPAPPKKIKQAEASLGLEFPKELKSLLAASDGLEGEYGEELVFSLDRMVEENQTMRTEEGLKNLFMPFDHLLFIGGAGNGDLFAYRIMADGSLGMLEDVFVWNHEDDSRKWAASGLRDLVARFTCELLIDGSTP